LKAGRYITQRYLDGNLHAAKSGCGRAIESASSGFDTIITVILRKSKREPVDFLQEMAVFVMKNAHGSRRRKIF